jgi:micrococcal nuclease
MHRIILGINNKFSAFGFLFFDDIREKLYQDRVYLYTGRGMKTFSRGALSFTLLLALLLLRPLSSRAEAAAEDPAARPAEGVPGVVTRVVDGDTVIVRLSPPPKGFGETERVRLIGIDAPESVRPGTPVQRFSEEAAAYTRRHLSGKKVSLRFDREPRDRYGRVLAYLYLDDGTFFNARMIEDGYAYAYTKYPFRYLKEFRDSERRARRAGRGLWAED